RFRFLIPKMRLYTHKEDCQFKFSFNYMDGCGRTDGEVPERGWAKINEFSTATREMNGAHRHEVLDDRISDVNLRKTVDM
ncbi:hypothetical protein BOTBODRAFT_76721, partial [Botryobasidium botryosum FD-172 SS1]